MGRGRRLAWVGGGAAVVAALFACGQLVGIGNDPPEGPIAPSTEAGLDAGAGEGGFTYGQGACGTCVATNCGAEATKCAGTPSCALLEGCMSGCNGDPTCRATCGADDGLGYDDATPGFEACVAQSCSDPGTCNLPCGGLAAVFPPATANACERCIVMQECANVARCAVEPGCQAGLRCQFSSRTPDVQQACPPLFPDAGPPLLTAAKNPPIAVTCPSECSWGADWSCLGHVGWPAATKGPVLITVDVSSYATTLPIAGALVRACDVNDAPCMDPIAMGTTDDAGTVVLDSGTLKKADQFYFDITSPSIAEYINFDVAPESEPQFRFPATLLPPVDIAEAAATAGVTLDAGLGVVDVFVHDCRLAPAPGVTFTMTPKDSSTLVYNQDDIPYPSATATDSQGIATFYNADVAPTALRISMTLPVPGQAAIPLPPVFTRPGAGDLIYVVPPP